LENGKDRNSRYAYDKRKEEDRRERERACIETTTALNPPFSLFFYLSVTFS